MPFSQEILKLKLSGELPGIVSHLKMAPAHRADELKDAESRMDEARKSAVMILFFRDEQKELKMIVIRRSEYVGVHSGQIAFPGGRYEEEDGDVEITALREVEEEIGIPRKQIEVLGRLSDIYVPPSNFLISVFVGFLNAKPLYRLQEREVSEVIEIPFKEFYRSGIVKQKEFFVRSQNASSYAPYFDVSHAEIWGASAMVISELLDVLQVDVYK